MPIEITSQPTSPSVDGETLPTISAMRTALGYMRSQAQELEKIVLTVSGASEGAEIYRDSAKCIEAALSRSEAPSQTTTDELLRQIASSDRVEAVARVRAKYPALDPATVEEALKRIIFFPFVKDTDFQAVRAIAKEALRALAGKDGT